MTGSGSPDKGTPQHGIDGLTARITSCVKGGSHEINLCYVYVSCLNKGIFPDVWEDGRLLVLPKGNGKPLTDPKSYCPITLLPVLRKLLELVIIKCVPNIGNQIFPTSIIPIG